MDLIYLLANAADATAATGEALTQLCSEPGLKSVTTVVGYVVLGIKIIAPIVLLIVGMIDMTKAIAGKDEDTIKKAQKALGKKAIAAVVVFLIATMVGLLMGLVGSADYQKCAYCINHPTERPRCGISTELE